MTVARHEIFTGATTVDVQSASAQTGLAVVEVLAIRVAVRIAFML